MKNYIVTVIVLLITGLNLFAEKTIINPTDIYFCGGFSITNPIILDSNDSKGNKYSNKVILNESNIDLLDVYPNENAEFEVMGNKIQWSKLIKDKKNIFKIENKNSDDALYFVSFYLDVNRFMQFDIDFESNQLAKIYIENEDKGNIEPNQDELTKKTVNLKLEKGKYKILIKFLVKANTPINFKTNIATENKYITDIVYSMSPDRVMNIEDIYSGKGISNIKISPSGNLVLINYFEYLEKGKTKNWYEIKNLINNYSYPFLPMTNAKNLNWGNDDFSVYYTVENEKKNSIYEFNFSTGLTKEVVKNIDKFSSYMLSPDNSYLVYSITDEPEESKALLRRIDGMNDRLPGSKNITKWFLYDFKLKISKQLFYTKKSIDLYDISQDGRYIIYGYTEDDYQNAPFSRQTVNILDLNKNQTATIFEKILNAISPQFSPDGTKLLCTGGVDCFDGIGRNLKDGVLANNYDVQAFIYDIKLKKVDPITKQFNPSVSSAYWNPKDNFIYIIAVEGTRRTLYQYNSILKKYQKYDIKEDYITQVDYSKTSEGAVFLAQSSQSPTKFYKLNLYNQNYSLVDNPLEVQYKNVKWGNIKDFDFANDEGIKIEGRLHYPPNFDSTKKYPVIVYYYAGTTPVSRNFGGRWPFEIWTGAGYIVYCLQPSGTIGYGQEFSAKHVNNWGKITAKEIIDGTTKLLDTFNYCDKDNLLCLGASYGGFSTMQLLTQTKMFKAAISHAGISSISSYWGEGFWGYLYSAEASKNSYPWNNKELYINQSPLFNADKITTPILLLHGDSDTNVPPGESIQFYTALKILGKEAELVMIKNTDHIVNAYEQRIVWHNTILAWFDKHLKNQPEWWNDLYPAGK